MCFRRGIVELPFPFRLPSYGGPGRRRKLACARDITAIRNHTVLKCHPDALRFLKIGDGRFR